MLLDIAVCFSYSSEEQEWESNKLANNVFQRKGKATKKGRGFKAVTDVASEGQGLSRALYHYLPSVYYGYHIWWLLLLLMAPTAEVPFQSPWDSFQYPPH
jgi:hypothetical protein